MVQGLTNTGTPNAVKPLVKKLAYKQLNRGTRSTNSYQDGRAVFGIDRSTPPRTVEKPAEGGEWEPCKFVQGNQLEQGHPSHATRGNRTKTKLQ